MAMGRAKPARWMRIPLFAREAVRGQEPCDRLDWIRSVHGISSRLCWVREAVDGNCPCKWRFRVLRLWTAGGEGIDNERERLSSKPLEWTLSARNDGGAERERDGSAAEQTDESIR